jgi:hypothetical protein
LFASGKSGLSSGGQAVFSDLVGGGAALDFDTGGVAKRQLVIHGHTDADGKKDENLLLGYERAYSVYRELKKHGPQVAEHVVLCTHADNSAAVEIPDRKVIADDDVAFWKAAKAVLVGFAWVAVFVSGAIADVAEVQWSGGVLIGFFAIAGGFLSVELLGLGRSRGSRFDLSIAGYRRLYGGLFLALALISFDAASAERLGQAVSQAKRYDCPDAAPLPAKPSGPRPGCALVIRAFELGYADDIGDCAAPEPELRSPRPACARGQEDEPTLRRFWRKLREGLPKLAAVDVFESRRFGRRLPHLRALAERSIAPLLSSPRASHHMFTNIEAPELSWAERAFPLCSQTSSLGALAGLGPEQPGRVLAAVMSQLLFAPELGAAVGYCREHSIHWGADPATCTDLRQDPSAVLARFGLREEVDAVLRRREVDLELRALATEMGETATAVPAADTLVSFQCLMLGERQRLTHRLEYRGQVLIASELGVEGLGTRPEVLELYPQLATVLAPGFAPFGAGQGLNSNVDSSVVGELLDASDFPLSRLENLAGINIFEEHGWLQGREELLDVYPFHIHLHEFVRAFRAYYSRMRGRL